MPAKKGRNWKKKDLDVWIRPVTAFSTLGWFKDPLYSYMKEYSVDKLANLIIHELVHATVYIKGQANFNEELAEFIGNEGSRLYMESRFGLDSAEYREMLESNNDYEKFVAFLHELIEELDDLYSKQPEITREEILIEKQLIIERAKNRFNEEYDSLFSSDNFRNFSTIPVNNAYLELYRLYYDKDNYYENLYNKSGVGLTAFIAAAKTIKKKGNPREQLEKALQR
jgi:predicted aminopeptidase